MLAGPRVTFCCDVEHCQFSPRLLLLAICCEDPGAGTLYLKTNSLSVWAKPPADESYTESRTIMAQVTDSSSAPIQSPLTPSDVHARTRAAMSSPGSAQEKRLDVERCIQDLDPSHSLTVSDVEDCNLECSYCALRWSVRRVLDRRDS